MIFLSILVRSHGLMMSEDLSTSMDKSSREQPIIVQISSINEEPKTHHSWISSMLACICCLSSFSVTMRRGNC